MAATVTDIGDPGGTIGAAQIDLVSLTAADVDWNTKTITFFRRKTGKPCVLRFGDSAALAHEWPALSQILDALFR